VIIMKKILLINPPMEELYKEAKVKDSVPHYPPLNLLIIGRPLLDNNHRVKLIDLNYKNFNDFKKEIETFKPTHIGITFTTPLYSQILKITKIIKTIDEDIIIVAGGVHITSLPKQTLEESKIDIGVIGEGEETFLEILTKPLKEIKGIVYKKEGKVIMNERRPLIKDLDNIPFPAYELIDIQTYKVPHTYCKKNPVGVIETSRGCVYGCVYCNKSVFGRNFRIKSPIKVIEEVKKLIKIGYKEIHILDDGFTTDMGRAKKICELLLKEKIKLYWNCPNGIRADRVNKELLKVMKDAGFYRVSFGVESGSQRILDNIKKGETLDVIKNAFKLCKKLGIETTAFFMFGLPGETEKDIKTSIKFAKEINPDIAKFDIMIPLPSTPIFDKWKSKGIIISTRWDDYGFYKGNKVYEHPNLSWRVMRRYLNKAYKSFYFSPKFLIRRLVRSLITGNIIKDVTMFVKIKW